MTTKQEPEYNYVVVTKSKRGYTPYGAAREAWFARDNEIMLSGPYNTGKSLGGLQKLHNLLIKYPKSRGLIVRKSYKSLLPSALATYYNKVLPLPPSNRMCPVKVYGGSMPKHIEYPNDSVIMLGGLDDPQKILSSEYDFVFVPQAEELTINDWEQLTSRCDGRAGNAPYPQMIGDCNPDVPTHWILNRPKLRVFHSRHTDNPILYKRNGSGELSLDENGQPILTEQGKRTMEVLQAMTGVRYKRGYLGLWVGAEGLVYEDFDPTKHVIDNMEIQKHWRKFMVIDFGYNHPFCCQFWAVDGDGRLVLFHEFYMTGRTVRQHYMGFPGKPGIKQMAHGIDFEAVICDWDAESRATLEDLMGIETVAADKRIQTGIEAVQARLKIRGDGRPGIYFVRDALMEVDESLKEKYKPTNTIEEFSSYVMRQINADKEETSKDEKPLKVDDHGMDCVKYMVAYLDCQEQYGKPGSVSYA